jgi:hypothetical protein
MFERIKLFASSIIMRFGASLAQTGLRLRSEDAFKDVVRQIEELKATAKSIPDIQCDCPDCRKKDGREPLPDNTTQTFFTSSKDCARVLMFCREQGWSVQQTMLTLLNSVLLAAEKSVRDELPPDIPKAHRDFLSALGFTPSEGTMPPSPEGLN